MLETGKQRSKSLFHLLLGGRRDPGHRPPMKRSLERQNLKSGFSSAIGSRAFVSEFSGELYCSLVRFSAATGEKDLPFGTDDTHKFSRKLTLWPSVIEI